MRLERPIELVEDHARLHAHEPAGDVNVEDLVQVPRDVDDDAGRQRLPVGAGAAAPRREGQLREAGLARDPSGRDDVGGVLRVDDRLREYLIDRVVGCRDEPSGGVGSDFTAKAGGLQGGQIVTSERVSGFEFGEARDHQCGLPLARRTGQSERDTHAPERPRNLTDKHH